MYKNIIVQEDIENIREQKIDFEKFRNKNVLITGANGMIASYYMFVLMSLNDFKNMNIKIYALVRNVEKLERNTNYSMRTDIVAIKQDVCEKINIDENIDYIIHMASSADPKTITSNPVGIINANVLGTLNVLELAREKSAEIIFTSTREVYGKVEGKEEIKENDIGLLDNVELRSCYPESKRMAENLIISYSYQYGIKYKIARIAHCYGPGMNIKEDGRIMSDLIGDVVQNKDIILKSKGDMKRAFCYILDGITALLIITLDENYNQIYNIANETEEITVRDLAYLMKDMYPNKKIDVKFEIEENTNKYVKFERVRLNTNKLEKLSWKPIIKLKEGIQNTVCFYEMN